MYKFGIFFLAFFTVGFIVALIEAFFGIPLPEEYLYLVEGLLPFFVGIFLATKSNPGDGLPTKLFLMAGAGLAFLAVAVALRLTPGAETERFMKEFTDQMATERKDYLLEFDAIGWERILDPQHVKADKALIESKVTIGKAKEIVKKYQERHNVLLDNAREKVKRRVTNWFLMRFIEPGGVLGAILGGNLGANEVGGPFF